MNTCMYEQEFIPSSQGEPSIVAPSQNTHKKVENLCIYVCMSPVYKYVFNEAPSQNTHKKVEDLCIYVFMSPVYKYVFNEAPSQITCKNVEDSYIYIYIYIYSSCIKVCVLCVLRLGFIFRNRACNICMCIFTYVYKCLKDHNCICVCVNRYLYVNTMWRCVHACVLYICIYA